MKSLHWQKRMVVNYMRNILRDQDAELTRKDFTLGQHSPCDEYSYEDSQGRKITVQEPRAWLGLSRDKFNRNMYAILMAKFSGEAKDLAMKQAGHSRQGQGPSKSVQHLVANIASTRAGLQSTPLQGSIGRL